MQTHTHTHTHTHTQESKRDAVKDWVLAMSMDQEIDRALPADQRGCFVASLYSEKTKKKSEPCVITGASVGCCCCCCLSARQEYHTLTLFFLCPLACPLLSPSRLVPNRLSHLHFARLLSPLSPASFSLITSLVPYLSALLFPLLPVSFLCAPFFPAPQATRCWAQRSTSKAAPPSKTTGTSLSWPPRPSTTSMFRCVCVSVCVCLCVRVCVCVRVWHSGRLQRPRRHQR
jgi:hypothetical protein